MYIHWLLGRLIVKASRFESFHAQESCVALNGKVTTFSYCMHYFLLCLKFMCNHGIDNCLR